MADEGYGQGYKYVHDSEGAVVPGEIYLPDDLSDAVLYEPTDRGDEAGIRERLSTTRATQVPPRLPRAR